MKDHELEKEIGSLKFDLLKMIGERVVAYRKRNPNPEPMTVEEQRERTIKAIKALCKTLPLFRTQLMLEGLTNYEATDLIEGFVVDALYPIPKAKKPKQGQNTMTTQEEMGDVECE